jgi:ABC-type amino acid transport substrate-binding protein
MKIRARLCQVLSLIGLCLYLSGTCRAQTDTTEVIYPAPESAQDVRYSDLVEILRGALDHTVVRYGPYRLEPSEQIMNEARQFTMLDENSELLNVIWSSTSEAKERNFIAIRIPLRKGLLGYRIALIDKGDQARFDAVQNADDLKKLTVGQGIGWGDVAIYNGNGFHVVVANYDQLFPMLAARRFDFFPRGIGEVFHEYEAQKMREPNLAIEQHLLIEYPWPYYFFLNRSNRALAERIETGLRAMIKDGSLDAIFKKYNSADIERAQLKNRRIIRIDNPLLPKDTPLDDPSLWFDPVKGK